MDIKIVLIVIACLASQIVQGCSPITQLPKYYQTDISVMQMHRDASNTVQTRYNYIFNFPANLLSNSRASNLKSILSIQQMQWQYTPRYLKYRLSKYYSETAILITFEAERIQWNNFKIKLLINDFSYRPQIYFGQLDYKNPIEKVLSKQIQTVTINSNQKYTKIVSFITGIQAQLNSPVQELYQFSVNQKLLDNNVLEFTIKAGTNTNLKSIVISYICYVQPSLTAEYRIVSGNIIFGVSKSGQHYSVIDQILPITQIYMFGISQLKFNQAFKQFSLKLGSSSANIFSLIISKNVYALSVNFFGVGVSAAKVCQQCPFEKYVFSENSVTYCLPKCPSDNKLEQDKDKIGKMCLKCPKQLNLELRDGGCFCKRGYVQDKGRCIEQSQYQRNKTPTFSQSQSSCVDSNSIKDASGQCVCKEGFKKNNFGDCISQCIPGFWNNNTKQCVYCPPETYIDENVKQCVSCGDYCQFCESLNRCAFCNSGFTNNEIGGCSQVCGDGLKFIAECDDANTNNKDGCSSTCKIQKGYQCKGGSQRARDVCKKIQYSAVRQSSQASGNGYIINYVLTPTPSLFTVEQLKSMIWVRLSDAEAELNPALQARQFYYQVYPTQDPRQLNLIKIFIYFGNTNLTFNPLIRVQFLFPNNFVSDDTFTANIVSSNSYFSTRFSSRTLN